MQRTTPIYLFTDFGSADVYVGQVHAVLCARAPGSPVIDLLNNAPRFDASASAHLLAALSPYLPAPAVVIAVVDPGVGSDRHAVTVCADDRWFVGPDNGLLSIVAARAHSRRCFRIVDGAAASASFHGRDLFAPVAATLATAPDACVRLEPVAKLDVSLDPGDLAQVIYVDHYGNAMTGLCADALPAHAHLMLGAREIPRSRVFSDVPEGALFCYANSIGLLEIAANRASAAGLCDISVGDSVRVVVPPGS